MKRHMAVVTGVSRLMVIGLSLPVRKPRPWFKFSARAFILGVWLKSQDFDFAANFSALRSCLCLKRAKNRLLSMEEVDGIIIGALRDIGWFVILFK